jgi:CDP-diacylglycerol--inositol 3-phosphatidyltransferase
MKKSTNIVNQHMNHTEPSTRNRIASFLRIILYLPNVIGYIRILFVCIACYYMEKQPIYCITYYGLSCLLDALDGYVARLLNQCTQLGAVMDMVVDRVTTTCLLIILTHIYSDYLLLFLFIISLDWMSHYIHMYNSLLMGSKSHKIVDTKRNWFLRRYYGSRILLFSVCAGNELFFICIYYLGCYQNFNHLNPGISLFLSKYLYLLSFVTFPICMLKQWIHLVQLISASKRIILTDIYSTLK